MLLHKTVKIFAFLLVLFIFKRRFGFNSGVSQPLKIAQFKAARTIVIILKGRLAEGGQLIGHGYILPHFSVIIMIMIYDFSSGTPPLVIGVRVFILILAQAATEN